MRKNLNALVKLFIILMSQNRLNDFHLSLYHTDSCLMVCEWNGMSNQIKQNFLSREDDI